METRVLRLQRRKSPASYLFPAPARLGAAQLDYSLQVSHFRGRLLGAHLAPAPLLASAEPTGLLDSRHPASESDDWA